MFPHRSIGNVCSMEENNKTRYASLLISTCRDNLPTFCHSFFRSFSCCLCGRTHRQNVNYMGLPRSSGFWCHSYIWGENWNGYIFASITLCHSDLLMFFSLFSHQRASGPYQCLFSSVLSEHAQVRAWEGITRRFRTAPYSKEFHF